MKVPAPGVSVQVRLGTSVRFLATRRVRVSELLIVTVAREVAPRNSSNSIV
ncbi:hypothetical protein [Clostridium beijerinckii]|uniref:hypothetical protein n=1 Tax=Clostridium beijerinckii TaxID=1520 RepID=UPI0015703394|nr:hypothetical protein [Clostridium beijerinckii]NSB63484.1 hypothetical protein [Clostridium beijerinckii]